MHGAISAIKRHLGTRMWADSLIMRVTTSGTDTFRRAWIEEIWFWQIEMKRCEKSGNIYAYDVKKICKSLFLRTNLTKNAKATSQSRIRTRSNYGESHNFLLAFIFGEQWRRVNDTQSKRERKQGEELFGHVQDASRRARACVTKTLAIQTVETKNWQS